MSEGEPEFDTLVRSLRDVEGAQARLDSVAALAFDLAGRFELQPLLGRRIRWLSHHKPRRPSW